MCEDAIRKQENHDTEHHIPVSMSYAYGLEYRNLFTYLFSFRFSVWTYFDVRSYIIWKTMEWHGGGDGGNDDRQQVCGDDNIIHFYFIG